MGEQMHIKALPPANWLAQEWNQLMGVPCRSRSHQRSKSCAEELAPLLGRDGPVGHDGVGVPGVRRGSFTGRMRIGRPVAGGDGGVVLPLGTGLELGNGRAKLAEDELIELFHPVDVQGCDGGEGVKADVVLVQELDGLRTWAKEPEPLRVWR